MKICVLIKQVAGTDSRLRINDTGTRIEEENLNYVMNESDSYALEESLQIKESVAGSEVVIISLGPDRVQKTIREALAKGADRAIHVQTTDINTDPFVTATQLTEAIKEEEFDLVLSGLQSDDMGSGQTGLLVGEMLEMPTATLVVETDISDSTIRVKRELESGWLQWITMKFPACLTIQSGINTPRYPSLRGIMGAKKKEIRVVKPMDVNVLQSLRKIYIPKKTKRTEMIEGDTDQVVIRLIDVLKREIKVL